MTGTALASRPSLRRPIRLLVGVALQCSCLSLPVFAASQTTMSLDVPDDLTDHRAVQVIATVEPSSDFKGGVLTVTPPPGFAAEPAEIALPPFTGTTKRPILLRANCAQAASGKQVLLGRLAASKDPESATIAEASCTFRYVPLLDLWPYLVWGAVGIGLGYLLRILIRVLTTVPPPTTLGAGPQAETPTAGRITRFVTRYYYPVDVSVTLVLGLLALLALCRNGIPPDSAAWWGEPLKLGVGLGLLTNSELLTKIKK